jgi:undecaprenyl pyrophosphate synthase
MYLYQQARYERIEYRAIRRNNAAPARQIFSRDRVRIVDKENIRWAKSSVQSMADIPLCRALVYGTAVEFTEIVYKLLITVNETHARGQSIQGATFCSISRRRNRVSF